MFVRVTGEAGVQQRLSARINPSSARSAVALSVLMTGIGVTFAWIGTTGWFSLRLIGVL